MKVITTISIMLFSAVLFFLFFDPEKNVISKTEAIIERNLSSSDIAGAEDRALSNPPGVPKISVDDEIKISAEAQAAISFLNEIPQEPSLEMDMLVLSEGHNDDILSYSEGWQSLQDLFLTSGKGDHFSHESEGKYLELIAGSEQLAEYALRETDCRVDSCMVSFYVEDDLQHERLINDFLKVLSEKGEGLNVMVDPNTYGNVANFYVGLSLVDR